MVEEGRKGTALGGLGGKEDMPKVTFQEDEENMVSKQQEKEEEELRRIESLLADVDEDGEVDFSVLDEEKEAERLAQERRLRREALLNKYSLNNSSDNNMSVSTAATLSSASLFGSEEQRKEDVSDTANQRVSDFPPVDPVIEPSTSTALDIFSTSPVEASHPLASLQLVPQQAANSSETANKYLESNWDDGEGYYKARVGELVADRYRTLGVIGKGVFSTVLRCVDTHSEESSSSMITPVAVKLIRSNDVMRKAAEKELSILQEIARHDPDNKKYCVRLLSSGEYRNHVLLVFEHHQMNLREAIRKFGKDVGINIGAVKLYARQLLVALRHLSDLRIVHADIKPDNVLVSEDLKQVKLCDFGSAFHETDSDNNPTPYLVSRFYRAPEIILGLSCKQFTHCFYSFIDVFHLVFFVFYCR